MKTNIIKLKGSSVKFSELMVLPAKKVRIPKMNFGVHGLNKGS